MINGQSLKNIIRYQAHLKLSILFQDMYKYKVHNNKVNWYSKNKEAIHQVFDRFKLNHQQINLIMI